MLKSRIANSDPDNTDRAFAYRAIAASNHERKRSLIERSCNRQKGRVPIKALNPFHFHFVGNAARRLFPDEESNAYFMMSHFDKVQKIRKSHSNLKRKLLSLAKQNGGKIYSQVVIFLFGEAGESLAAETELATIENQLAAMT